MSVDTKAYLIGDVPFEKILAFLKRTEDADAKVNGASDDKWAKCAWVDFRDGEGKGRSAFLFRSKSRDDSFDRQILEATGNDGVTIVSLASNEEGKRIMLKIAERFGGWYVANDCDGEPPLRVYRKDLNETEMFLESAKAWKSAARKLKQAAEKFRMETEGLDPKVLELAENVGVFRLNGKTLVNSLESLEGTLDAAVGRIETPNVAFSCLQT